MKIERSLTWQLPMQERIRRKRELLKRPRAMINGSNQRGLEEENSMSSGSAHDEQALLVAAFAFRKRRTILLRTQWLVVAKGQLCMERFR
jgi:hypothetical protein